MTTGTDRTHRGTIWLEEAEVLAHDAHPGGQYVLSVRSPQCAAHAEPGSFAHLRCAPRLPMRRPLSIMRADPGTATVEFLYKTVGRGLSALAERRPGDRISLLGPIGRPFAADPQRRRALLLGGGVGIPPMLFLADRLRAAGLAPLVLMGSEVPFPFELDDAPAPVPGMPGDAGSALRTLESGGVPSRLASLAGLPGCHRGYVTDLADAWLRTLDGQALAEVAVYACGPTPMLRAVAALAARWQLPCEVSLEEYMACAVGGCAGCAVRVQTPEGPAMKRVCVDGPVFDARAVFAD